MDEYCVVDNYFESYLKFYGIDGSIIEFAKNKIKDAVHLNI
jgi:hypothetical protein